MQRFFSPTTMPATDCQTPLCSHEWWATAQGGLASALNNTARQIGLAIGIAVLGALLESGLDGGGGAAAFTDGVGELLLISAAIAVLGALAAALLVRQRDLWAPPAR